MGKIVTENTLWDYADNLLSMQERQAVEIAIATDPILRAQLDEILQFQQGLSLQTSEFPNANLSQQILQSWAQEQAASQVEFKANYRPLYVIMTFVAIVFFIAIIITIQSVQSISLVIPTFDFYNQTMQISLAFISAIIGVLFIERLVKYRQNLAL